MYLERPTVLFIFVFSVCMCISLYVIVHACTDLTYSVHHCLLSYSKRNAGGLVPMSTSNSQNTSKSKQAETLLDEGAVTENHKSGHVNLTKV